MQFTKESPYQRCIAPDMHPTKDIIYQRCTKIVQMASGRPLGSKFGQKCPKKRQRMAKIHFLGGIGESVCCHHVWIPTRHLLVLTKLCRWPLGSPKDPYAQKCPKVLFLVHHPMFLLASCADTQKTPFLNFQRWKDDAGVAPKALIWPKFQEMPKNGLKITFWALRVPT